MSPRSSAVVTGGSSGLGSAVTEALLDRGLHVVVADLKPYPTEHEDVTFLRTDVTIAAEVRAAVQAGAAVAPIRVAVACAGVPHTRRLLGRNGPLDLAEFDDVVRINMGGAAALLTYAAEAMSTNSVLDGDRGVIALVSSIAAYDGGSVAYAASKAGVAGMVLPAAQNLAEHCIRVMGIAPGPFQTPLLDGLPGSLDAFGDQSLHPKLPGDPAAFAALVAHVIDNPMLNGEVIRLDGGARLY